MQCILNASLKRSTLLVTLVAGETERIVHDGEGKKLMLGLGERQELTLRQLRLLVRKAVMWAQTQKETALALDLSQWQPAHLKLDEAELIELIVTNGLLASYAFNRYKTAPRGGFPQLKQLHLLSVKDRTRAKAALNRAIIVASETNAARDIANHPAGDMTPDILAKHAKKLFRNLPVKVTVWDEKRLAKEKMAAILAVGRGSMARPRFIIAEYQGGTPKAHPTVLVGKGVTFDSGGINLKPSQYILGMNMDMSGGATVLHVLAACARLKVKKNIVVLVPAVENMISGESYRPGDIIRTASGKTIEVQDTDAEGRIILSDALHYAKRFKPALVIDVATLTGAAVVALGERASGLFTTDEKTELALRHIGERVGDPVWPLPLWDEYLEDIKGTYADIANVGSTKYGGASTAALFLKQFTDYPWVHLDIAPRMTAIAGEYLAKGSIGAGVQLLIRFLASSK